MMTTATVTVERQDAAGEGWPYLVTVAGTVVPGSRGWRDCPPDGGCVEDLVVLGVQPDPDAPSPGAVVLTDDEVERAHEALRCALEAECEPDPDRYRE